MALHHAGFSVPPVLPPERWALTPPFHPCLTELAFRRRLAGFPVRCHRAPLRRRSILCGTFRDAVCSGGFTPPPSTSSPGVTRRVAHVLSSVDRSAVTTKDVRSPLTRVAQVFTLAPAFFRMNAERPTCLTTVSGLSSRFGFVAAALRRRSSASASDHPAHPPIQLYAFPA